MDGRKNLAAVLGGNLLYIGYMLLFLLVIMVGARMYESMVAEQISANEARVCTAYLVSKIRGNDWGEGNIAIEDMSGTPCLRLTDKDGYVTRIYAYGGYLRELYTGPDGDWLPEDGTPVTDLASLGLEAIGNGFLCELEYTDGGRDEVFVAIRSGRS